MLLGLIPAIRIPVVRIPAIRIPVVSIPVNRIPAVRIAAVRQRDIEQGSALAVVLNKHKKICVKKTECVFFFP